MASTKPTSIKDEIDDDAENSDNIYDVERILNKKIENNVTYYHIKWQGYSMSLSTWEHEDNLASCPLLVEEFEKKYLLKQQQQRRKRSCGGGGGGGRKTKRLKRGANKKSGIIKSESNDSFKSCSTINTQNITTMTTSSTFKAESFPSSSQTFDTNTERSSLSSSSSLESAINFAEIETREFDKSLLPDYICGAIPNKETRKLYFVVKWKNPVDEQVDVVYSEYANKHFPQAVIKYYESKIEFYET